MSIAVDRELAEARAVIAAIRVQAPRLGRYNTADDALEKLSEILAAKPADVLRAHTLLAEVATLDAEGAAIGVKRDALSDASGSAVAGLDVERGRVDARAQELRAEARGILHRR